MNNIITKTQDLLTNWKINFKHTKTNLIKLQKCLPALAILLLLTACAAISGRETAGEYVDDASITASVKSEILQDPQLKMFQIHVETFKNQVQLSGFVDSLTESARAGQIARNVQGVQDVKNNLVVRKKGLKSRKNR
jgi:hyperosmotically inducible protein